MKKSLHLITLFLAVIMWVALITGCNANVTYSETFSGKISSEAYSDSEAAAMAFLENEVAGNTTAPVFIGYTKTADVEAAELETLNIPQDIKPSIDYAEKGEVAYSEVAAARVAEDEALTYRQGVYIFKIGSTYRYFVPSLSTGEVLTKSYMNSVFDCEKYSNLTITATAISEARGYSDGQYTDAKTELSYTYKITKTVAYIKLDMRAYAANKLRDDLSGSTELYLVQTQSGLQVFIKNGDTYGSCQITDLGLNFTSLDDIYRANFSEFADHTYFEKTANGFKLRESRANEFILKTLGEQFGSYIWLNEADFTAEATYFVSEGRLQKTTVACSINVPVSGYSIFASSSAQCTYSNFGTTYVKLPYQISYLV